VRALEPLNPALCLDEGHPNINWDLCRWMLYNHRESSPPTEATFRHPFSSCMALGLDFISHQDPTMLHWYKGIICTLDKGMHYPSKPVTGAGLLSSMLPPLDEMMPHRPDHEATSMPVSRSLRQRELSPP